MDSKKRKVISLPEYKGDLNKLFDFEHPVTAKEAFGLQKKHEQVIKKLKREFRKRYVEEMTRVN
ncbi:MAG: hypothetical protein H0W62_12310 [Chitinophagales bacterium]|nr:hypothetical protein [Chitinophagales bacterium]